MPIRLFEIAARILRVPILRVPILRVPRARRAAPLPAPQTRGFTLLRLLGVIALVGTLSALAAPAVFPAHP